MKKFIFFLLAIALFASCKHKATNTEIPSDSIFYLTSDWQNQNGKTLKLNELKGKTLVVVMIYTTCRTACPLLVADMKAIEQKINPAYLDKISLVLVSIDPDTDTPERLKKFAVDRKMDAPHWVFLRGNVAATQEFANVLSMKYKKISPVDFSHSNIISIFNPLGKLVSQEEGTGINAEKVAQKVNETVETN